MCKVMTKNLSFKHSGVGRCDFYHQCKQNWSNIDIWEKNEIVYLLIKRKLKHIRKKTHINSENKLFHH